MHTELSLKEMQKEWHGSLRVYILGFMLSFFLTTLSFLIVGAQLLEGEVLIFTLVALAVVQAICQLWFFLHIGNETKPRWRLWVFYGMVQVLLIIVFGSVWIMYDLNERVMSDMKKEMHD